MGTDIHGVFQRRDNGKWVDVPSEYEQNRHYQLFAALAGVRNGTGFAGIETGQRVEPISEPRGFPSDFEVTADDNHAVIDAMIIDPRRRKWLEPHEPLYVWMGDHSHSWLTSTEMLAWLDKRVVVVQCGIISREYFDKWDKKTHPNSYCGGISGHGVVVIDESEVGKVDKPWTHVRVTWESSLSDELGYFFNEVKRLHEEHGEVRFVFGFDS